MLGRTDLKEELRFATKVPASDAELPPIEAPARAQFDLSKGSWRTKDSTTEFSAAALESARRQQSLRGDTDKNGNPLMWRPARPLTPRDNRFVARMVRTRYVEIVPNPCRAAHVCRSPSSSSLPLKRHAPTCTSTT